VNDLQQWEQPSVQGLRGVRDGPSNDSSQLHGNLGAHFSYHAAGLTLGTVIVRNKGEWDVSLAGTIYLTNARADGERKAT